MTLFLERLAAILTSKAMKWSMAAIAGLILSAAAVLYGGSEWLLARTYDVPRIELRERERPPSAERGARWSVLFGCQGCHGPAGHLMFERPWVGRVVAPNLSRVAADYTDDELVVLIRAGIKRDRTSAVAMPADAFAWMADEDVADVIAWLRSLKPAPDAEARANSFGPPMRLAMLNGRFPFSAEQPDGAKPPVTQPAAATPAHGRYLANVLCLHCHRLHEEHVMRPGLTSPPLAPMALGYDLDQFMRLLRTGVPIGERKLELMSEVALGSAKHLTDEEIASLHRHLTAAAADPP